METLAIGGTPHGLALAGGTLYVTDRSTNTLRRFTVGSWQELPPLAAGAWPHAVVPLPGGALAVANAAGDTLTIGARVVATSQVPETIAVAPDGTIATAGSVGGAIDLFDAGGRLLARHDVGGRPVRVLFAPDGRTLAAALSADGSVAIVRRRRRAADRGGRRPGWARLLPGRSLALRRGRGRRRRERGGRATRGGGGALRRGR